MELDKKAVAERFRKWLIRRFGSVTEGAKALGRTPDSIRNSYLNAKSIPGGELIADLIKYGCNVKWLLYGEREYIENPEINDFRRPLEYRVEAKVPAGIAEMYDLSEWYNSEVLDYDPRNHVFLQVDEEFGYSMRPLINPGDLVLISFTAKIDDGDIVAARWDETRGALKICTYISGDPNLVVLMSYNQNVSPMGFQKDKINMYKVVLIKRK